MFPEGGNLGLVLPTDLCQWTTEKVRKEGVIVHPSTLISSAGVEEGKVKVTLNNGEEVSSLIMYYQVSFSYWCLYIDHIGCPQLKKIVYIVSVQNGALHLTLFVQHIPTCPPFMCLDRTLLTH